MVLLQSQFKFSSLISSLCLGSCVFLTACHENKDTTDQTLIVNDQHKKALEINIIHINDSHSHLDAETNVFQFNTGNVRESIQVDFGGFARVTALIKQLERTEKNVIKVHAGDAITGDLYFHLAAGQAEADLMNTACFDTFTLGNHEFDNNDKGLQKFLGFLDQHSCGKNTAVLSANVNFGAHSVLHQTDRVQPYTIIEKEGQKIAFIGLTIANKTKNSSRPDADTTFKDELSTTQKYIDALKAQGINKIVLQSHVGYGLDQQLAQQLSGVDVIVGGDSHTLLAPAKLADYGLTPSGHYPTQLKNKDGDSVCVVQAWQYAYVVGQLKIKFDQNGVVQQCTGQPNILIGDHFRRTDQQAPLLNADEIQHIRQDINTSGIFRMIGSDPQALSVLAPYRVAKDLLGQQQLATASQNLCLRRVPGPTRDTSRSVLGDQCNHAEFTHQHGGDVQQLVAEAFLQQGKRYFNADIALINGGGVREDIARGEINVEKIYRVLAFKNTLVQLNMSAEQLHDMLEDAMDAVLKGHTGSYPYTAGLIWDVDLTQAKGQRVTNLRFRGENDQPIGLDQHKQYRLITIDFLADGQGEYHTLEKIVAENRIDVGLDYTEAFIQYLEDLPRSNGQKLLSRLPQAFYSTQSYKE